MAKFTPGNWETKEVEADFATVFEAAYKTYAIWGADHVATVRGCLKSDLRLIAKSPELYELLKEGVARMLYSERCDWRSRVKALLAEIDGEEPQ